MAEKLSPDADDAFDAALDARLKELGWTLDSLPAGLVNNMRWAWDAALRAAPPSSASVEELQAEMQPRPGDGPYDALLRRLESPKWMAVDRAEVAKALRDLMQPSSEARAVAVRCAEIVREMYMADDNTRNLIEVSRITQALHAYAATLPAVQNDIQQLSDLSTPKRGPLLGPQSETPQPPASEADNALETAETIIWEATGSALLAGESHSTEDRHLIYDSLCRAGNLVSWAREQRAANGGTTKPEATKVPEGWKLVPVEPNAEMVRCAREFRINLHFGAGGISGPVSAWEAKEIYERMLAAAPSPSVNDNEAGGKR